MTDRSRLEVALEDVGDGIALLRFAAQELPLPQRHLFLQGVRRLEEVCQALVATFEPVGAGAD